MKTTIKTDMKLMKFALVFFCLAFVLRAGAQSPISLQASIDSALKNNLMLKNEQLKTAYQQLLIKTATAIPQTTAGIEYGQINSFYSDTRFGLAQSINFPTVYSKQKTVLTETWKSSLAQIALKEKELIRDVSQVFYTLFYLQEKEILLQQNDSIYTDFLSKSNLSFKTGESNLLENITAETQRGQIRNQLSEVKADITIIQIQFQYLLNSTTTFKAQEPSFKMNDVLLNDSSFLLKHPSILLLQQQNKLASKSTELERSKLLPDLNLSYSNMSMRGEGADKRLYTTSTRFQSFQFGIGIPIFYGSQKASINAAAMNEQIAKSNYQFGLNGIKADYRKAELQYMKCLQMVNYYETSALKNAGIILSSAKNQFNNGEINYLDFVMLTNQAIGIQSEYINAIKNLNESIIILHYLNTNN